MYGARLCKGHDFAAWLGLVKQMSTGDLTILGCITKRGNRHLAVAGRIYVISGGPTPGASASAANEIFVP
jgi:transposase